MPTIAVVSYPTLAPDDLDWIESIRMRHDPQATRIDAHFTLVFPVDVAAADVSAELAAVAGQTAPIRFTVRSARAVPDASGIGKGAHVFLVPGEGASEISQLHDRLYSGVLLPHLRKDITFVPHITVAASNHAGWCQTFAERLSRDLRTVTGVIDRLDLVKIGIMRVEPLERFALGS